MSRYHWLGAEGEKQQDYRLVVVAANEAHRAKLAEVFPSHSYRVIVNKPLSTYPWTVT